MAELLLGLADPDFSAGGLGAYAWAFGQGVLVDLTPCVYPLIPITVSLFGASEGVSRGRALFLASAYVLGMAVLYTSLGVGVALTGGQFGAWLADPVVVVPIVVLLTVLAASMFGAFDLQLPAGLSTRLNKVGGAGPFGAFMMGLVSGLISAPCTGPVLLSLLTFIAGSGQGNAVYGGSLLFVYALGMGTLFFLVALGVSLFQPGQWMEYIKSFFGIAMLVMAFYFLRNLGKSFQEFGVAGWGTWAGLAITALGIGGGAIHRSFHGPLVEKLIKAVAVAVATVGASMVLNNLMHVELKADWNKVENIEQLAQQIEEAESAGRPILVDFGADWCLPCKEMELKTFSDPQVEAALAEFTLVKIDVTDPNDEQAAMQAALHAETLPAIVAWDRQTRLSAALDQIKAGAEVAAPTVQINAFTEPQPFLEALAPVR
jgi:thiol:disulfide interchange protein DsbD